MRFRAKHAATWTLAVKSDEFKRKRKEIEKRCNTILTDPYRAYGAHPYHDEWEGYWGAKLDGANRIMYEIDEEGGVITFAAIEDPHH